MEIPISMLWLFMALSFGLIGIGYMVRFSVPISLFIFVAGGLMMSLFIMIDTITIETNSVNGNPDTVIYEVSSPSVSNSINAVASPIQAEFPSSSSSQLFGKSFDCMSIPLAKTGAPPAGNLVRVGVWGATGNLIQQFGQSLDVQNMATGLTTYTFCLPDGQSYMIGTFPLVERIGAEYNYADAVNFVTARSDNANPFDGTTTFRQQYLAGWTSSTGQDLNMKLWLRGNTAEIIDNTFEFTEELKTFMVLMASMMLLVGAMVEIESRRR